MKKLELIFIPVPGVGHFYSAIEVAKLLTAQNEDLSITILLMKWLNIPNPPRPDQFSDHPHLKFIELRREEDDPSKPVNFSTFFFDFMDSHKTHVREILAEIAGSGRTQLAGVVVDMMCANMIDVVHEFCLPSYVFFPSCASFLGLMLHLQGLRDGGESKIDVTEFKDSGKLLVVPAYVNPVPAAVFPSMFLNKGGGCDAFLEQAKWYREAKGILINTFTDLETHALRSLLEDEAIPPVYPIGPVLNCCNSETSDDRKREESEAILKWLDQQPDSSVLFLCFGSMGAPANQVAEIAAALEKTGCRFLWSVRKSNQKGLVSPGNYEDLESVLPEGFLQRTAAVGNLVGWVPQAAVLGHQAVAGFVTHCGWNSVLESVWNGIPIATWPIYSEQQANAFLLVKDLGLAAEIKMDYRKDFGEDDVEIVSADLIENGIRKVMDSGNGLRKKMMDMKEKSRLAVSEGGSSSVSLNSFLDVVRANAASS